MTTNIWYWFKCLETFGWLLNPRTIHYSQNAACFAVFQIREQLWSKQKAPAQELTESEIGGQGLVPSTSQRYAGRGLAGQGMAT